MKLRKRERKEERKDRRKIEVNRDTIRNMKEKKRQKEKSRLQRHVTLKRVQHVLHASNHRHNFPLQKYFSYLPQPLSESEHDR